MDVQNEVGFQESIAPLMRPAQIAEVEEEVTRLERMLKSEAHVTKGVDRRAAMRRLRGLKSDYDRQAPKAYERREVDLAVRRRRELLDKITEGMPTQEEMRRNPSGAVAKHMSWERRNKRNILEFKNIELRLHATSEGVGLKDETELGNIERFRPSGGAQQLNMHNEQIQGKKYFFPKRLNVGNIMTDDEREKVEAAVLDDMTKLAATNPAYRKALQILNAARGDVTPPDVALTIQSSSGDE